MNVYRAAAVGFDITYFIIAAESIDEAHQIAIDCDMGSVDIDEVYQVDELSTNLTESEIIFQF